MWNCRVGVSEDETNDIEVAFNGLLITNDDNDGVAVANTRGCAFPFQLENAMKTERHIRVQCQRLRNILVLSASRCLAPTSAVVVVGTFCLEEPPAYGATVGRRGLLSHLGVCPVARLASLQQSRRT